MFYSPKLIFSYVKHLLLLPALSSFIIFPSGIKHDHVLVEMFGVTGGSCMGKIK